VLRMQSGSLTGIFSTLFAVIALFVLSVPSARAVPSYSRQTGMPCAACHYAPPELTPFGRTFKLEGYTFTTKAQVSDDKKDHNSALHLLEAFPLSAILDVRLRRQNHPSPAPRTGIFSFLRLHLSFWLVPGPATWVASCRSPTILRAIT
jgi:hypothetical protein